MINGLHVGSIYALIALGYTMVYGIVKLINFAHGDIIMIGAYTAVVTITFLQLPVAVAIISVIMVCVLSGVLIERIAYRPLRSSPRISSLITAIGVSMLLQNTAQLIFSATPIPSPISINIKPIRIGDMQIGFVTLLTIATSVVLMMLLHLVVQRTKIGKSMRAVSEDMDAAKLMGINVNTTITITFALGCALAGIGSILFTIAYPQVSPTLGSLPGLKAFIAAVLGGIGIIPGAMLGGFIMGIAESLTKAYISSRLSDAVVYGILIAVLLFKPAGLLGTGIREKV
jgi:branched-chain amino acid transport system permease protein